MWAGLAALTLMGALAAAAVAPTNAPLAAAAPLAGADACLAQLQQVFTDLDVRVTMARASNETTQADCLQVKQARIRGLINNAAGSRGVLARLVEKGEMTLAAAELEQLRLACDRALKILAEAEQCRPAAPPAPALSRPALPPGLTNDTTVVLPPSAPPRTAPPRPRGELHCLRQEAYACLLLRALQREPVGQQATSCTEPLAELRVAPLPGWRPERCLTLDDLVVTVARALGLTTLEEDDPARCLEAVRVWGLPVDALLPVGTAAGGEVLLREDEVRQFLARGLAGGERR